MKTITIGSRIWIITLVLCTILLGIGLISISYENKIVSKYSEIVKQNMPKQQLALELILQYRWIRIRLASLSAEGIDSHQSEKTREELISGIKEYENLDKEYQGYSFLPDEENLYKNVQTRWSEFKKISETIINLSEYEDRDHRSQLLRVTRDDCSKAAESYRNDLNKLIHFHKNLSTLRVTEAESSASHSTWITSLLVLLGTATGFIISFILGRGITKNLNQVSDDIVHSNETIAKVVDDLSSSSSRLATSSQEEASSVQEISSSLEEISGMVSSSLNSSKEAVGLTEKVSQLVTEGSNSMMELQESVAQISQNNTRVENLAKLIEEIGEKTELIDEIVFQTRLLSFNASVEAERAGEHGRGFTVVAQEIGSLAQMSGKSASEISVIVKSTIKDAREVSLANRAKVEQGVILCKKTASQLTSIQAASQEILQGSQNILRAAEEQSAGIEQINQGIQMISQSAQDNASSAEECAHGSKSLTRQSKKLTEIVTTLEKLVHHSIKQNELDAAVSERHRIDSMDEETNSEEKSSSHPAHPLRKSKFPKISTRASARKPQSTRRPPKTLESLDSPPSEKSDSDPWDAI